MAVLLDEEWFRVNRQLPSSGAIVEKISDSEVTQSDICSYFGPKFSKSGWKYLEHVTPSEAAFIQDLYYRVYGETNIPNKELTQGFAKGLVLQSRGDKVNWAEFAVCRLKYRKGVRAVKASNKGEKIEGSDCGVKSSPQVLGKKRSSADWNSRGKDISSFVLTPKAEGSEQRVLVKKVLPDGKGKGARGKSLLGPAWTEADLVSMEAVLERNRALALQSKLNAEESSIERGRLEGELRRAKMLRADRHVMFLQSKHALEQCEVEEMVFSSEVERNGKTLAELQEKVSSESNYIDYVTELKMALELGTAKVQGFTAKKAMEETSMRVSRDAVASCDSLISGLEERLQECELGHTVISARVLSLGSLLTSMEDQLQEMKEGRGVSFYPNPIASNPTSPIEVACKINACPVWSLWYSHRNFVSMDCGHTYHHWCLAEHSKKSQKCLLKECNLPFSLEWCASIGIRPAATESRHVKVDFVEAKKTPVPPPTGMLTNMVSMFFEFFILTSIEVQHWDKLQDYSSPKV
jgi:hypothetical protein